MPDQTELAKALDELGKATRVIRDSQQGRARPLIESRPIFDEPESQKRIDQLEVAFFAIEKALQAVKDSLSELD